MADQGQGPRNSCELTSGSESRRQREHIERLPPPFNKAIPLNPSQIVLPVGDQMRPNSFKTPQEHTEGKAEDMGGGRGRDERDAEV